MATPIAKNINPKKAKEILSFQKNKCIIVFSKF